MRPIIKANGGTVSYQAGLHGDFVCDAFYHIMGGPSAIPFTFPLFKINTRVKFGTEWNSKICHILANVGCHGFVLAWFCHLQDPTELNIKTNNRKCSQMLFSKLFKFLVHLPCVGNTFLLLVKLVQPLRRKRNCHTSGFTCAVFSQTIYSWGAECNLRPGRLGVGWCGRLLGLCIGLGSFWFPSCPMQKNQWGQEKKSSKTFQQVFDQITRFNLNLLKLC